MSLSIALAAAGATLLLYLVRRVRIRRDHHKIRLDLEKHRYQFISAGRVRRVERTQDSSPDPQPVILRAYSVEFTDAEGAAGVAICAIIRGGTHWNEDGISPGLEVSGVNLPNYGQNWRG